ncbi:hypothetical protein HMPREF9080_00147 [Cardiobacterium valvarum F0432]|uniref:Uncharacterized protein n=1 Tax=Cardiobacterium valvarum F0432 TaxID=797473 RepID=G9ZBM3_9GAMM|nr:hypothetical protein HMPREF9080_00147 [Cardiobacterium valvarum F0432]
MNAGALRKRKFPLFVLDLFFFFFVRMLALDKWQFPVICAVLFAQSGYMAMLQSGDFYF